MPLTPLEMQQCVVIDSCFITLTPSVCGVICLSVFVFMSPLVLLDSVSRVVLNYIGDRSFPMYNTGTGLTVVLWSSRNKGWLDLRRRGI